MLSKCNHHLIKIPNYQKMMDFLSTCAVIFPSLSAPPLPPRHVSVCFLVEIYSITSFLPGDPGNMAAFWNHKVFKLQCQGLPLATSCKAFCSIREGEQFNKNRRSSSALSISLHPFSGDVCLWINPLFLCNPLKVNSRTEAFQKEHEV